MSTRAERAVSALTVLAGLITVLAFGATFGFGYMACFTSGDVSNHCFNAAMVSIFLTAAAGLATCALWSLE